MRERIDNLTYETLAAAINVVKNARGGRGKREAIAHLAALFDAYEAEFNKHLAEVVKVARGKAA